MDKEYIYIERKCMEFQYSVSEWYRMIVYHIEQGNLDLVIRYQGVGACKMTKMDEAIALARRIVDANSMRVAYDTRELASALIAATFPGAEYRAGMERAAEAVEDSVLYGTGRAAQIIRAAIAALPILTTKE